MLPELWAEVWDDVQPIVEKALAGTLSRFEDMPLTMARNGVEERTWWSFSYSPLYDEDGIVRGLFCVTRETTNRVLADVALRASEQRYRAVFESAIDYAIIVADLDGTVVDLNEGGRRILGWEKRGNDRSLDRDVLHAGGQDRPHRAEGDAERAGIRPGRGRALASAGRRHDLLGQRRDADAARRDQQGDRLPEDPARPDRAARRPGALAGERGQAADDRRDDPRRHPRGRGALRPHRRPQPADGRYIRPLLERATLRRGLRQVAGFPCRWAKGHARRVPVGPDHSGRPERSNPPGRLSAPGRIAGLARARRGGGAGRGRGSDRRGGGGQRHPGPQVGRSHAGPDERRAQPSHEEPDDDGAGRDEPDDAHRRRCRRRPRDPEATA